MRHHGVALSITILAAACGGGSEADTSAPGTSGSTAGAPQSAGSTGAGASGASSGGAAGGAGGGAAGGAAGATTGGAAGKTTGGAAGKATGGLGGAAGGAAGKAAGGDAGKSSGGAGGGSSAGKAGSAGDAPLPYPTRGAMKLKGLQPDFWPDLDEITGNGVGGVAMNLVWAIWEGSKKSAPCSAKEQEYDGRCFVIDAGVDQAIRAYSDRGVVVTAVVYGVPAWARDGHPCSPVSAGFEIFCSPDDAADYGRFAGMLARRYDGKSGHGRVADFVIHNEVNANDWFDIGCGQGKACDTGAWLDSYAASWSAAYDRVMKEQSTAKVLVSLDHHFGKEFDLPGAEHPLLGGQTVLEGLAARVGARKWRVAMHPYPPDLLKPAFSPDDAPKVTYGSLGVLAGWLRKKYPSSPWTWEIQLTESGVNSLGPGSSPSAQADGVCKSLRNALGTPGVESYIYHRMKDHPVETASGLGVGLRDTTGAAKPAWAVWALANRPDVGKVSCGFEDLPYIRLTRSYSASRGHWASTREPPPGFTKEQSWRLAREHDAGTHALFECRAGAHSLVSPSADCEGLPPLGPLGYAWDSAGGGRVALYRCYMPGSGDHFVSPDAACEGQTVEQTLGWVVP